MGACSLPWSPGRCAYYHAHGDGNSHEPRAGYSTLDEVRHWATPQRLRFAAECRFQRARNGAAGWKSASATGRKTRTESPCATAAHPVCLSNYCHQSFPYSLVGSLIQAPTARIRPAFLKRQYSAPKTCDARALALSSPTRSPAPHRRGRPHGPGMARNIFRIFSLPSSRFALK